MSFKFLPDSTVLHPGRQRPTLSSPWELRLKITPSIRFQSKPAKNACTASSYPIQGAKLVSGNCESCSCSRRSLIFMEGEVSPAAGLCPELYHAFTSYFTHISVWSCHLPLCPPSCLFIFRFTTKIPCTFLSYLICLANFFLPCVMIPSYLMKGTNCVASQYAFSWVLYCEGVIRSQDKLPCLMS
jgi:hypothetical protein